MWRVQVGRCWVVVLLWLGLLLSATSLQQLSSKHCPSLQSAPRTTGLVRGLAAGQLLIRRMQLDATRGRKEKPDDIIDAVVLSDAEESRPSTFFNVVKNTAKAAFNGLAKVMPGMKKKNKALSKKEQRTAAFNDELDSLFAQSGLLGGVLKTALKTFGSTLVDNFAQTNEEIEDIQHRVQKIIEAERTFLGRKLHSYPPSSSSFSTFFLNGQAVKQMSLVYAISGSSTLSTGLTGQVQVQTSGGTVSSLVLRLNNGVTVDLTRAAQQRQPRGRAAAEDDEGQEEDEEEDDIHWIPLSDTDNIIDAEIVK